MQSHIRKLILLDGDDNLGRQAARVFAGRFVVLHSRDPRRAIGLIEADPQIAAIITEQVMRTGDGVELLETIRTMRPDVRRVMLTSYSDLAAIVIGLHSGAIQALVQKPVADGELLAAVCPEAARRATAMIRRASA